AEDRQQLLRVAVQLLVRINALYARKVAEDKKKEDDEEGDEESVSEESVSEEPGSESDIGELERELDAMNLSAAAATTSTLEETDKQQEMIDRLAKLGLSSCTFEERGGLLSEALFATDVLAYRGAIDTEAILDTVVGLHEELNDRAFLSSPNINEFVERYKSAVEQVKGLRIGRDDFEVVRTLARGQFGIVDIVRSKHDKKSVYAMKTLNKQALLSQREQAAFLEERDVLLLGRDSAWIPDLHAAFQDRTSLYLVMEFVAGGDLFSMLDRCEGAVIDEDAARFYAAELVLALEDLHAIGYVHRDCKPQNTLLDARGHVKLADFGSCARIGAEGAHEAKASVPVGTCDYIAPETLRAREIGGGNGVATVSPACDWWSVGAVLYEMLYGDPPFYSDSVPETYAKIMASDAHLAFDSETIVSDDAKDLMRRLL
ncbi:hypothetical protein GGI21_004689, partial [Coemansia aciculifera]